MGRFYTETELHNWYHIVTAKLNSRGSDNLHLQERGPKVKKSKKLPGVFLVTMLSKRSIKAGGCTDSLDSRRESAEG